jgi:hypothetical protein
MLVHSELLFDGCRDLNNGVLQTSKIKWCGAVAQLGERLVRNEEVSGSIPLSSTKETITTTSNLEILDFCGVYAGNPHFSSHGVPSTS